MPTFGYTTIGGTLSNTIENHIGGSVFTIPENGIANSITAYIEVTITTHEAKCGIYKHSDLSFVGGTEEKTIAIGTGWETFGFTSKPRLLAGVEYILVAWSETGGGVCIVAHDTGDTDQGHRKASNYNGFPDPLVTPTHGTQKFSIYCTYSYCGKLWESLKRTFSKQGSLDVTLRTLSLGDRDSDTGWRAKTYSDSTIQMIIATRDARQILLRTGTYVRKDAVGFTDTPVKIADEIQLGTLYYEVDAVRPHKITPDRTEYYKCDLTELPLHD